ncbi:MAG: hypothetical protein ACRD2X_19685 [Vicinamibacteraceae bacterium]
MTMAIEVRSEAERQWIEWMRDELRQPDIRVFLVRVLALVRDAAPELREAMFAATLQHLQGLWPEPQPGSRKAEK